LHPKPYTLHLKPYTIALFHSFFFSLNHFGIFSFPGDPPSSGKVFHPWEIISPMNRSGGFQAGVECLAGCLEKKIMIKQMDNIYINYSMLNYECFVGRHSV